MKEGLFENNEIRGNKRNGVSIGHKDTDNLFRHKLVTENASAGVLFRNEDEAMGAHRNVFEDNRILNNGTSGKAAACIEIRGTHHDLVFRRNTIGNEKPIASPTVGISADKSAGDVKSEQNRFLNLKTEVASAK